MAAFLASLVARAVTAESFHTLAQVMTLRLLGRVIDVIGPTSGVQVLADLLTAVAALLALRVVRMPPSASRLAPSASAPSRPARLLTGAT